MLQTPEMFEYARATLGNEIELCHDTHERLNNGQAVQLAESLQKHRLFFRMYTSNLRSVWLMV